MKPTAWLKELPPEDGNGMMMTIIEEVAKEWEEPVIPLYSKGAWVGLTGEERNDCLVDADPCECLAGPEAEELMRCIEDKLRSKNGY